MTWVKLTLAAHYEPLWVNLDRCSFMAVDEWVAGVKCTRIHLGELGAEGSRAAVDVLETPAQIFELVRGRQINVIA